MVQSNGSFVWYELMTTNPAAANAFYGNVLGWHARDASMPGLAYQLMTVETTPVAGLTSLPDDARRAGVAPHWTGYVGVDDIDAVARRVETLGGRVHVPPIDVSNISRFSIVADPQETMLALINRPQSAAGTSITARATGCVGWHELLASSWEKAFAFYTALFGWQKAEAQQGIMGTYQQFSAAGETIGGMYNKPPTLPHPFWLYYFNVADIQAAAQRVEANGGEILYGPVEVPGGNWIVHCLDPQGAIFALLNRPVRKAVSYFVPGFPDTGKKP